MANCIITSLPLIIAVATSATAVGQVRTQDGRDTRFAVTPYVGIAFNSPAGRHLGVIPNRNHLFLGVQVNRRMVGARRVNVDYAPQFIPLILVSDNPRLRQVPDGGGYRMVEDSGFVSGVGFIPVAFEASLRLSDRWQLFGGGGVGFAWFSEPVPVLFASRFNYTFEYGAGLSWAASDTVSLRAGYRFHHLSNGGSAFENPGLDGNVVILGITKAF